MSVVYCKGRAVNLRGAAFLERRELSDGRWVMVAIWVDAHGNTSREEMAHEPATKDVIDRRYANYSLRLAGR